MTGKALAALDEALGRLQRGTTRWGDWARLSKLKAAKASEPLLEPVRQAAGCGTQSTPGCMQSWRPSSAQSSQPRPKR